MTKKNEKNENIETMETVAAETPETPENVKIEKMEMPVIKRGVNGPRKSKYDFLKTLEAGTIATFEIANEKKVASLRTTLFGWAKRNGLKLKTVFNAAENKLHVSLDN
jgi:hypothetical protein